MRLIPGSSFFFYITLYLLPVFRNNIERQTQYGNCKAYADDGNTCVFKDILKKHERKFNNLNQRVDYQRI